jgi:hypothetical protein
MFDFDYVEAFGRLLKYYYNDCPGRVTPLLLLYLAQDSKPGKAKVYIEEKIRKPLDWKEDPERNIAALFSLSSQKRTRKNWQLPIRQESICLSVGSVTRWIICLLSYITPMRRLRQSALASRREMRPLARI